MHFMYLHCKLNVHTENTHTQNETKPLSTCVVGSYDLFKETNEKKGQNQFRQEAHLTQTNKKNTHTRNKDASAKRMRDRFS